MMHSNMYVSVNIQIANKILYYVDKNGWGVHGWYVGIATDVTQRLFTDHNVDQANGGWIYDRASSVQEARETEKYLLQQQPFKGGPGGGSNPMYVYAYQITRYTIE